MPRMLLLATVAALAIGLVAMAAGSAGDAPDDRSAKVETGASGTPQEPTDGPFALAAQRPRSPTQPQVVEPYDRARPAGSDERGSLRGRMRRSERTYRYRAAFFDDLARRLGVTNIEIRRGVREALASLRSAGSAGPIDLRTITADDLVTIKREMAERLGEELEVGRAKVVSAVRAEMIDTLRWMVDGGTISKEARAQAVDCFDDPAACDVTALRTALHLGTRGR